MNAGIAVIFFHLAPTGVVGTVEFTENVRPVLKSVQKKFREQYPDDLEYEDSQIFRSFIVAHYVENQILENVLNLKPLNDTLTSHILENAIDGLAVEAGFVACRHLGSVIPLVRVEHSIQTLARKYRLLCSKYAPCAIKKVFTGKGNAKKEDMTAALNLHIAEGSIVLPEDMTIDDLTEHQIDAIAIGYTHVLSHRTEFTNR